MTKRYVTKEDFEFDEDDPLARGHGESALANQALVDYATMGGRRSVRALWERYLVVDSEFKKNPKKTSKPPTTRRATMVKWSYTHHWIERAKLYDEQVRRREQERYEDERITWRLNRLKAAQGLLGKAVRALNNYDVDRASLSEITRALQIANEELRVEFGEEDQLKSNEVIITVKREDKKPDADTDD
ncbi:MAG: hypothetical protein ACWGQW_01065 [bacterium]